MDLALAGKVAFITGAAKGMGAAITRAFAAEECALVLAARDTAALDEVAHEIQAGGTEVLVVACDLRQADMVVRAVEAAERRFDGLDVLVNIAGGSGPIGKTGAETTPEEFDEIVSLNMGGVFNAIRAVAPGMSRRGAGSIVNVGGTFGMRGRAGRLAYSASKWGLRGITKSFALELGPHGINVNNVAPGMVDGPRFRTKVIPEMARRLNITEDDAVARHAADYALGRISTGEDVAAACVFLASPRARQITGVDLPVDGGWAAL